MLKKIGIAVVVVAVIGVFIWGVDGFKGAIGGSRKMVKDAINENTSSKFDVGRIEVLMRKNGAEIEDFTEQVTDLKSKMTVEEGKIVKLETEKTEQLKALAIAGALLKEKKETYIINKESYSFAQVDANANSRLAYVTSIDERVSFSRSLIADLDITYKNCQADLIEARKIFGNRQGELKKLQAREVNAEIKARARKLKGELEGLSSSITSMSALTEAFNIYEKKVAKKERNASDIGGPVNAISIPYNTNTVETVPTVDKIDQALAQE